MASLSADLPPNSAIGLQYQADPVGRNLATVANAGTGPRPAAASDARGSRGSIEIKNTWYNRVLIQYEHDWDAPPPIRKTRLDDLDRAAVMSAQRALTELWYTVDALDLGPVARSVFLERLADLHQFLNLLEPSHGGAIVSVVNDGDGS